MMSKGAKTGNNWEFQVYFDPESDKRRGRCYNISDDSLISEMSELIDYREKITDIWVYRCPLSAWQLTQVLLNHQFVVLETNDWWWSIEKNTEEIVIQRSKDKSWVRDYLKQKERNTPVEILSSDKGRESMESLIAFLYLKNEVNKTYDWINDNCKNFAKRIFDKFAATKINTMVQ